MFFKIASLTLLGIKGQLLALVEPFGPVRLHLLSYAVLFGSEQIK